MLAYVNDNVNVAKGQLNENEAPFVRKNASVAGLKRTHTRKALGDIANTVKQESAKPTIEVGFKGLKIRDKPQVVDQKTKNDRKAELSVVDQAVELDAVYVAPYAHQIVQYMRATEGLYCVPVSFLARQSDVTARMRSILVDWIVEVHHRFKLNRETLFLAVNYLDRYLNLKQLSRSKLQLAGVTALWIASKVEDVYQPEMRDFEFVTDKACSCKEMLEFEADMLETLDFQLLTPTAACFQERYLHVAGVQPKSFVAYMSYFFLECSLGDLQLVAFKPSLLAAASVYLAKKACKMTPHWNADMDLHTGYSQQSDIRAPAKALCAVVNDLQKSSFQAVRIKYSSERFKEVAREVLPGPVPSSSNTVRAKKR